MLIGKPLFVCQMRMNPRDDPFIAERRRSGLDMSHQVWSILITGLSQMHLIPRPEDGSFLRIAGVEVVRRGHELGSRQDWFSSPPASLFSWLNLLFEDWCRGW